MEMNEIKHLSSASDKIRKKRLLFWGLLILLIFALIILYDYKDPEGYFKTSSRETSFSASPVLTVAGGIVPLDNEASGIAKEFFKSLSRYSGIRTIILMVPDSHNQVALTGGHFIIGTNFRGQNNNVDSSDIITALIKNPLVQASDVSIKLEEEVTNLYLIAKAYFPQATVIPILVSPLTTSSEIKQVVEELNTPNPKQLVVIGGVNFSRGLPDNLLLLHEATSLRTIINFEENEFPKLDVDSWQVLYAVRYFGFLNGMERAQVLTQTINSHLKSNSTANILIDELEKISFCSLIFTSGKPEIQVSQSVLLVGDIMMARGVDEFTKKYGLEYPFIKIKRMFKGVDVVYGNLEGPIMINALPVSLKSVSFVYPVEVVSLLKDLGFTVLNIANNHMKDQGGEALLGTRKYLEEYNIFPLGDYQSCDSKYSYQNGKILFIGAHLVYNNSACVKEIIEQVTQVKKQDPRTYIIVTPHWGNEYTHLANAFQRTTAHLLIESGVDAIIGHHPHVVQSIEEYRGKPIFYSLGNFVFDMYFSKAVQEELAVGVKLTPNAVTFYLVPIRSHQSQLEFMDEEESRNFLTWLSTISSPIWQNSIKNGILTITNNN